MIYWTYRSPRFILRLFSRQDRTSDPVLPGRKNSSYNMNTKIGIATLGAALMLAGAPALASAADAQTAPIHINSLQTYGGGSTDAATVADPSGAQIGFTNNYGSPATEVVFAVFSKGAEVTQFDDRGSFAPGVAVDHTFPQSRATSDQSVAVVKATFADGSTWQNPAIADEEPASNPGVVATVPN